MADRSFKTIGIVGAVSVIIAVLVAIMSFILPERIITGLYGENRARIENALERTLAGDNSGALGEIELIAESIEARKDVLMVFYNHENVDELTGSVRTAYELAKTDDTAQLVVELRDIERAFDYLICLNGISFIGIF